MSDLEEIKQAIVNYGLLSPFVREMVKTCTSSNSTRLASINLSGPKRQIAASLEGLLNRISKNFKTTGKAKGLEISRDQILGEGLYSDPQDQTLYKEHTWSLHSTAALNAWDRIQKPEKRTKSYVRVKQGQREPFSDFLQRLTKAVQIRVTDLEARRVLVESWAFENVNLECKKMLRL